MIVWSSSMAPKKKSLPKKNAREKLTLINLKVSSKDRDILLRKAKRHTDGNLSALLRKAALKYSA